MRQKVVLIHGLFCNRWFMYKIERDLKKKGYEVLSVSYPTVKKSLVEGAKLLAPQISNFKSEQTVFFVGHSMGGLMIRYLQDYFSELFMDSRVVTLGSPHQKSSFAEYVHKKWPKFVLGKAWKNSLDGNVPLWNEKLPLLSIAGTKMGVENRILKVFKPNDINDGLVSQNETQMTEFKEFRSIHLTHGGLCFNAKVVQWIDDWFQADLTK